MNLLASFAPFIIFAVLIHLGLTEPALWAGALVAAGLILRDRLLLRRSVKLLELGTMVLFAGLALYTAFTAQAWTIPLARLVVDAGLLVIVLLSLAIGLPFTLQYAREDTPEAIWAEPEFLATNRSITAVWAGAFAVLTVADAIMAFMPQVPHGFGVLLTVAALYGAFRFTKTRSAGRPAIP
ncbi:hypothetical protein [Roseomonas xinghualingensis]|uniref:hypothetical protein n=1 Tax=Roseomonas xinghualingensis TaxID=2986475 RepID=UPI0021F1DE25|nr:hypothetical protein [Roseomonas sp. SXEYE001]MCV4207818.1 hypothetical protein [Roseomonas sp. SXEYE001]